MADKDVKQSLMRLAQERGLKESLYDGVCLSHPYLRQVAEVAQTMVESGATRKIEAPQKTWGLLAQAVKLLMVVIKDVRDVYRMTSDEIYDYLKEALPQYSDKLTPEVRDWLLTKFDTSKETILFYIRKFLREYSQESKELASNARRGKPRKRTKEPSETSSLTITPLKGSLDIGEVAGSKGEEGESLIPKERNKRQAEATIALMKKIRQQIKGYAEMERQCPLLMEVLLRNPHLIEPLAKGEIHVRGEEIQRCVSAIERQVCLGG